MSATLSAFPSPAGSPPDQINQKARTWYFKFQLLITATIASISGYDEWKIFWKTKLDSPFRNKNLTKADIITISSQKNSSNLGSSDGSNHAMNAFTMIIAVTSTWSQRPCVQTLQSAGACAGNGSDCSEYFGHDGYAAHCGSCNFSMRSSIYVFGTICCCP